MTLPEALKYLAASRTVAEGKPAGKPVIIASGGKTDDADNPPMLCVTRGQAAIEWLRAMRDYAEPGSTIRWSDAPAMYRYQVTLANAEAMTHRIVQDRFAVVAGVVVGVE